MTVEKPKPKQLLRPITTGADSAMNQSQFLAITCNSLEAREKSRVHGAIGFGFDSHWLKNWRDSFKPVTKRSNRNYVITFDSHLKTALIGSRHSDACSIQIEIFASFNTNRHGGRTCWSLAGRFGVVMEFLGTSWIKRKETTIVVSILSW